MIRALDRGTARSPVAVGVVAERDHVDAAREQPSASLGVMPMPLAAFSPLTTTKSSASSARSPGSSSRRRAARRAEDVADEEDCRDAVGSYRSGRGILACMAQGTPSDTARGRRRGGPATPAAAGHPGAARGRRAGRRPALGADGAAAAGDRRGVPVPCRRAGLLLFTIAGLIALLLNPFVAVLQRGPDPARGGGVDRDGRARRPLAIGFLLGNPISDQVSGFQRNVPHCVDDANPRSPTSRLGWTATTSTSRSRRRARPRCRRSANGSRRHRRRRQLHARRGADAGRGHARADPDRRR